MYPQFNFPWPNPIKSWDRTKKGRRATADTPMISTLMPHADDSFLSTRPDLRPKPTPMTSIAGRYQPATFPFNTGGETDTYPYAIPPREPEIPEVEIV